MAPGARTVIRPGVLVPDFGFAIRHRLRGLRGLRADAAYRSGDRAPVLLLPGVYETWTFLRPLAEHLHAAGHPVHVLRALGANVRPIPESAALAQEYLRRLDLRGVVLVAHSKGGLIGKHMLAVDDVEGRVERLVALATPFGGSTLAGLFPNRALRAFLPTDPLILDLGRRADVNARIISVFPRYDTHIPAGSHLEGAVNVELPLEGHFRIVSDPRTFAALDALLAD